MTSEAGLKWRRVFHGRDVEATWTYLRTGFGDDVAFEPARRRDRHIDVRSEGVDLPGIFIHHTRLARGFAIEGRHPDPHYVLFLPLAGRIAVDSPQSSITCDPRRGFILCRPTAPVAKLRTDGSVSALVVRFSQATMKRRLAALLHQPVDSLPEFTLGMDLTARHGQSFARYLLLAMMDFKQAGSIAWNPIMIGEFEDFITSKLLMSHPHNFTRAIERADKRLAPGDVLRAIEYMHAKLASPITIADITAVSGIAGRTLFKHF